VLTPPEPVFTADLFGPDRDALLQLLADLAPSDWQRPTACAGWSVHDVALHLLGGDLGNLSRRRDGHRVPAGRSDEPLVALVNRINDEWVAAARRLSPAATRELLADAGPRLFVHFASLDPMAIGAPVSWAGPDPAPVWLDVAREYTERWMHQQHIRAAVERPGQREKRFFAPVVATFVHALPMAFVGVAAPEGTTATLSIAGDAGGSWTVARSDDRWRLFQGAPDHADAEAAIDQDAAWRLFTKGLPMPEARRALRLSGDRALAEHFLACISIIG
jgi:uncharacterized protein (TIGR03083 family)